MAEGASILILYITEHSGHHSAALAIKNALLLKDPQTKVTCINGFRYVFPIFERLIHKTYLTVIKKVPKIWEKMYDHPKVVNKSQNLKGRIHAKAEKKIAELFLKYTPDAVICTQAFPCGLVADYKRSTGSKVPLIGVLTDYVPHSFWSYENVDFYIAPCLASKKLLTEKGVPVDKIKAFGIPIDPKFSKSFDKNELFANYGLDSSLPVIMIMGGGHGLGPIRQALVNLDGSSSRLQLIVVCGINNRLYNWITKTKFKNRILCFKYTDQIEKLMSVSSLIITKPGGITTAESLAKRLPMIILNPIPGQESRNTHLLTNNGVAKKIDSPNDLLAVVNEIINQPRQGWAGFSLFDKFEQFSKPNASLELSDLVFSLVRQKMRI